MTEICAKAQSDPAAPIRGAASGWLQYLCGGIGQ